MLDIKNLKVAIEGKEILKGIDLEVKAGHFHVLMGPNGSGKSTLAQVLMGSPGYKVHSSQFTVHRKDISKLSPDKRAKMGIFLAFQHPVEIPGVSIFSFLRKAKSARSMNKELRIKNKKPHNSKFKIHNSESVTDFRKDILIQAQSLKFDDDILRRSVNEGFSGGEKKRSEILQMMALKPKLVILDEIDSGLDVDALKLVAGSISKFVKDNPKSSVLLITHYARILKYLKPDFVHIIMDGKIIRTGSAKLAQEIEQRGYRQGPSLSETPQGRSL